MPSAYAGRVPGIGSARTATPRTIFLQTDDLVHLAAGKIINGTLSRDTGNTGDLDTLRSGVIMGKITATGLYRPTIIGLTNAAISAGSATTFTATVAAATEISRLLTVAGGNITLKITGADPISSVVSTTAAITVSAANTSSGVITCSSFTFPAFQTGAFIHPADGAENPVTLVSDQEGDGYGIKVTDEDGVSLSQVPFAKVPIRGTVDSSQIVFWPSQASMRNWITDRLPLFAFDHHF